jgi:hypothetical protein
MIGRCASAAGAAEMADDQTDRRNKKGEIKAPVGDPIAMAMADVLWEAFGDIAMAFRAVFATAITGAALVVAGTGLVLYRIFQLPIGWIVAGVLVVLVGVLMRVWGLGRLWLTRDVRRIVKEVNDGRDRSSRAYLTYSFAVAAAGIFAALLAAFAVFTAALQAEGLVTEKPPANAEDFVWTSLSFYGWNLLNAMPALKVPQTLNWAQPTKLTDYLGGSILLIFKIVVIFPLFALAIALIRVWTTEGPAEAEDGPKR